MSSRTAIRAAAASLTVLTLLAAPRPSLAQGASAAPRHRWELLGSSGALVPTGELSDAIKRAPISTAQLSYVLRERVALTTTLGWARSRDLASAGDPRVSVFSYDVGAEARTPPWGAARSVVLFTGAGAGGRSFNHRDRDVDATHDLAAYGAVGGDVGAGRVRLRLEAREYLTGFRPLAGGGAAKARNDVVLLAGLRFARKPAKD